MPQRSLCPSHLPWYLWYCCAIGLLLLEAPTAAAANFVDGFRWRSTYTNGSSLGQGDPTTLRWSIVPDNSIVEGRVSNLVSYLDGWYGAGPGGDDLTLRPWFANLAAQFSRLADTTGLSFVYVTDDGAQWTNQAATSGHGDIRIGGYDLITPGELGRANLPAFGGDLLLDTANATLGNATLLGGVFQHEVGHSLSLLHVTVPGTAVLMNTSTIPTAGPQFDDLYALVRLYGDRYESDAGNDTPELATLLGTLEDSVLVEIGSATDTQVVHPSETDFASIDDSRDVDLYRFDTTNSGELGVTLTPRGPSYTYFPQGGSPGFLDAMLESDLQLRLLAADGVTSIATANQTGIGEAETLSGFALSTAGTYYLEVTGSGAGNQFYHLSAEVLYDTILGDYNRDGVVNLADYTVWRDSLGSQVADGAGADGNGNGEIDSADYMTWKSAYRSAAAVTSMGVPEPRAFALLAVFAAALPLMRATRREP